MHIIVRMGFFLSYHDPTFGQLYAIPSFKSVISPSKNPQINIYDKWWEG